MSKEVVIIDYGMGNLGSISNMLKYIGADSIITSDHNIIENAEKIILPGVGHFDRAMNNINELNLVGILRKKSLIDKVPFLGICLGMQLMCRHSEEGNKDGLGLINADEVENTFNMMVSEDKDNFYIVMQIIKHYMKERHSKFGALMDYKGYDYARQNYSQEVLNPVDFLLKLVNK